MKLEPTKVACWAVAGAVLGAPAWGVEFSFSPKVIYGDDDRRDLYEISEAPLRRLADSTVALIQGSDVRIENGLARITAASFRQAMGVCDSEPFANQPSGAFCSGALVGPDLVMTAGHCVETLADCQRIKFAFGYAMRSATEAPETLPASEVYGCRELVAQRYQNDVDYALVRLDRSVENHAPLAVNRKGDVAVGAKLGVIGHPSGLPTKIAFSGEVRSVERGYFVASLDTYGGNSGSPVFNRDTGLIEGILVRGEQDFDYKDGCYVSKRCGETECRGEDVTLVSELRDLIP